MNQLSRQSVGKRALIVAAIVLLSVAAAGCKRSDSGGSADTSSAASAALASSGVMNGNAATGSTADTSSGGKSRRRCGGEYARHGGSLRCKPISWFVDLTKAREHMLGGRHDSRLTISLLSVGFLPPPLCAPSVTFSAGWSASH